MVRSIVKDPIPLSQKCAPATAADLPAVRDLLDTLAAHEDECVGLAANMIGVNRRIVVIEYGGGPFVLLNPELEAKSGPFEAEEGCLSLAGLRRTTRYRSVRVRYLDTDLKPCRRTLTGFPAQILQHELDHCNGILI